MANYYICTIKKGKQVIKERFFEHCSDDAAKTAAKYGKVIDIAREDFTETIRKKTNRKSKVES